MKNSVLNQANILQELKNHQEEMAVQMEQNLKINTIETMIGLCEQMGYEEKHPPSNHSNYTHLNAANSANNLSLSDKAIFQLLKTLKVEALSTSNNTPYSQVDNSQVDRNKSGTTINTNTGQAYKRYCWSYGCGGHWSRHCENSKPGNKNEANFKDRMGGSNKNCLPIPQK